MREILFRGKRTDNGEWIYGYVNQQRGEPILDCMYEQINSDDFYIYDYAAKIDAGIYGLLYKIIPKTVGQYTGLTDKNGVRIFEGDIVICKKEICGNFIDSCVEIGFVEMKHGAFGLHRKQGYYRPFKDWLEDYEYEVIGNIHDNPDILNNN